MSDSPDGFVPWKEFQSEMNERSKVRRGNNRRNSTEILRAKGVAFESKNSGIHLVVNGTHDFWPGTGKWISRASGKTGRGVFKLLEDIQ